MKILLTGNNGFIGSAIQARLSDEDCQVYTFDFCKPYKEWITEMMDFIDKIVNLDLIIHCGAISDSGMEGNLLWEMNYQATEFLARYASKNNNKFLFISSCAAINPINQYGWGKRCAEDILRATIDAENLCIFRLFNVWSWTEPTENRNPSIVSKIINQTLEQVYPDCTRDFIHINDVADAVYHVVIPSKYYGGKREWRHGIFEIGTGEGVKIYTLVNDVYAQPNMLTYGIKPPPVADENPVAKALVANKDFRLPHWTTSFGNDILSNTKGIAKRILQNTPNVSEYKGWVDEHATDDHLISKG